MLDPCPPILWLFLPLKFPSTAAFIYIRQANVHLNTPGITKSCYCILAKTETSRTSNSSQHGTRDWGKDRTSKPHKWRTTAAASSSQQGVCRGFQAHGELQHKPPAGPSTELGAPSKQGTGKPIKCHQELNAKSRAQKPRELTHSLCNGGREKSVVSYPCFSFSSKLSEVSFRSCHRHQTC